MRYFCRVSLYCDAEHCYSHRPRSISNRKIDIFIISLSILSNQAAIHDVIDRGYHIFIASSLFQNKKEPSNIGYSLSKTAVAWSSLSSFLLAIIFLLKGSTPISYYMANPQIDFITNAFEGIIFFVQNHGSLLFQISRIISQSGFDKSISIFCFQFQKLLIFLNFFLKFFIVIFHIVSWILEMKFFNCFESLITSQLCFAKESDWLMKLSQFCFDFLRLQWQFFNSLFYFNFLPSDVIIIILLEFFQSLC